jgi:hypothetical protein
MGFDLGVAVMCGCKSGKVLPPNIVLRLGYSLSAFPGGNKLADTKGAKTGVRGFSAFSLEYPKFEWGKGRVAFEPSLEMVPEIDLKAIGIPVSGSVPINLIFKGLKDFGNNMKGYSLELGVAAKSLVEQGPAKNENDAEYLDPRLGPLGTAIKSLAETSTSGEDLIDSAAAQASQVFTQRHSMMAQSHSLMERATAAASADQSSLLNQSREQASSIEQGATGFGFDIAASATFSFCLTIPKCWGQ